MCPFENYGEVFINQDTNLNNVCPLDIIITVKSFFIRSTFNFVYFVGRAVHEFMIKYLFIYLVTMLII